jgi:hypothetical protein
MNVRKLIRSHANNSFLLTDEYALPNLSPLRCMGASVRSGSLPGSLAGGWWPVGWLACTLHSSTCRMCAHLVPSWLSSSPKVTTKKAVFL